MAKVDDDTNCPVCNERAVYRLLRGPDPEQVAAGVRKPEIVPLRKLWQCDSCGWEDENSAPREPYRD